MFLLFYGKIGKGINERTRSESEIDDEELAENINWINAMRTEYHDFDGAAGTINKPYYFLENFKNITVVSI